ncbi:MAG TPA: AMP-binding protein, partial [Gemmataceae bacterium]|nr:AMP-binding protein [Gemmataceae bacterium]
MAPESTVNVATQLAAIAAREPDRPAVYMPHRDRYRALNFAELDRLSGELARGLDSVGVRRGVRTVLMVAPSLDFFALTFALFKVGAVPVLIDPGMGVRNLGKCLAEVRPEAFVGVWKAHLARRLLRWARDSIRITVATGRRFFGGRYTTRRLRQIGAQLGPLPVANTRADETAAILFTSGSTGVAKGVVYTHGIFAAQVEYLKQVYGIEPGEVDLSTFPLFALFGPALGMTAVIPDMD